MGEPIELLMKIIFLHPTIDGAHSLTQTLSGQGAALLFPADATEAWQMMALHGASIDLSILHLEGRNKKPDATLELIKKLKKDERFQEIPIIITTDSWSDAQCAQHQGSPEGVNGYIRAPVSAKHLWDVIQAVLGVEAPQKMANPPASEQPPRKDRGMSVDVELEDGSEVHLKKEPTLTANTMEIGLKMPPFGANTSTPEITFSQAPQPTTASQSSEGIELSLDGPPLDLELPQRPLSVPQNEEPFSSSLSDVSGVNLTAVSPEGSSGEELSLDALLDAPASLAGSSPELSDSLPPPSFDSLLIPPPEEPQGIAEAAVSATDPFKLSPETPTEDPEMAQEMPYLLDRGIKPAVMFAEPLGDAVVPGGAAQTPDVETLKKYLLLREQDVAVLSSQLQAAREQNTMIERLLREERAKCVELNHVTNEQNAKLQDTEKQKSNIVSEFQNEIEDLKFQLKTKTDKARVLELQIKEVQEEIEHLKDRVRSDIRKIRVREKELENRIEIIKKDSEVLMGSREMKITELKRKLDLMEFNMDLLQDQYNKEKDTSSKLREHLAKAAQVVRVAGGLLDVSPKEKEDNDPGKKAS